MPARASKPKFNPDDPKSQSLFDEVPAAPVQQKSLGKTAKKHKKGKPAYEWGEPFLENGKVWCHIGYGDWQLRSRWDEMVQHQLERFRGNATLRKSYAYLLSQFKVRMHSEGRL